VAKKLSKAIAERDEGIALIPERTTVAQYLRSWLERSARPSVSAASYKRYRAVIEHHVVPNLGRIPLRRLTPGHIEMTKNHLLSTLSPTGVRYVLVVLSTALEQAVRWEMLNRNPATAVRRPKGEPKEHGVLTEEQVAILMSHVRGTRFEVFYGMAIATGMRQAELSGLRWQDLDLKERQIALGAHATKTRTARTIKISRQMVDMLNKHKQIIAAERLAYPGAWDRKDLVFPSPRGKRWGGSNILKQLRVHLAEAGLPPIRFHDLRDTSATLMLRRGVKLPVVAQILGHKDPAMTLRRYTHVLSDMEDDAAEGWSF
jgi:integrase